MWWSKGLGCLPLCYLIDLVTCVNLLDFLKYAPITRQLQNGVIPPVGQFDASSSRLTLPWLMPTSLQPVTVQCREHEVAIVVRRDLFGTGHLIQSTDLSLGLQACHATVMDSDDFVLFVIELHECGSHFQTTPDYLHYHTSLYYKQDPASNPITVRNRLVEIPIECHYSRKGNMSSNAIKPTWVPFISTTSAEGRLHFTLRLMNDDWSDERASTQYRLGDNLHIQAHINGKSSLPLRLFVDSCVAMLMPGRDATPHYAILDFHGCLVDGRAHNVASAFVIPRPWQETLQLTIAAFRFAGDTRNQIYIKCHLKATAAVKEPDPFNKACWFNRQRNTWLPVEGSKDICNCCETKNCGSDRGWPRTISPSDFPIASDKKHVFSGTATIDFPKEKMDADLMVGPLSILDATWGHQGDQVGTEEMRAVGKYPVIEAVADSAVAYPFILKADEELRWLLDSNETLISNDEVPHTTSEDFASAKLLSDGEESSDDSIAPVKVAKMLLQGIASEKGTVLGRILTTVAGIGIFMLLNFIS